MKQSIRKLALIGSIILLLVTTLSPVSTHAQYSANNTEDSSDTIIKLDPSYQHSSFDGWGTALVWFANVTGGWPEEVKNELADELFGVSGLNLNIARYNIGGEDSPETEPYMRLGGAVPGYWNRPDEFGPPDDADEDWEEQEDWWDPDNPNHWDWDKDKNQQWWLEAAKQRGANLFEAFSNSPPYFMTNSGYTSGNWNSAEDNLQEDQYENFATYLTRVVEYFAEEKGISFQTLSPVNEPNTNYWGAQGRQEGSHWDPASQARIIEEVSTELEALNLKTVVSAMDETNPTKFRENWYQYRQDTINNIGQMNVHTYGPSERTPIRDIAKGENKRLWMSEVDLGPSGIPQDFDNIEPGLALSERITSDIMSLEPKAWVLWQAIEDQVNMNAENENMNWGLIHVDFDPENFEELKWHKNKKYYTMANYTKFIRPGFRMINSDNENTLAAINKADNEAVVVYTNTSASEKSIDIDLSGFGAVDQSATASTHVTSAEHNLAEGETINIEEKSLTTAVEPKSVTTFVISGVAGVDEEDAFFQENKTYKIENQNSEKVLDLNDQSLVQYTAERENTSQEWKFKKVTDGYTNKEEYQIINAETNEVLTHQDGDVILSPYQRIDAQKWIISTSGNGDYTLINKESGTLLEVGGQSTEEGATVGVWQANAGTNQQWAIVEAGITTIDNVTTWTTIGNAPSLPDTVTAKYGDGEKREVEVIWDDISPEQYDKEGDFVVEGTVEQTSLKAEAVVYVGEIVQLTDTKVKTVKGMAPELPNTVTAELSSGREIKVPVNWDEVETSDYATYGQFKVNGQVEGTGDKAVALVQVAESVLENLALSNTNAEYPKATASFTGQWDDVNRVNDGDYSSNRWTNWDPNEWRETDWVEIDFGQEREISEVKFTFYDDQGGTRPPESLFLEYWNGSDWVKIDNSDVEVDAEDEINIAFDAITTDKVRTQLTAMPDTCIAIVEIEVYGFGETPVIGEDATLKNIWINHRVLENFKADNFRYEVEMEKGSDIPAVEVETNDLFATYEIELPESLPGEAKVTVTAENEEQSNTYTIDFMEKLINEEEPENEEGTDEESPNETEDEQSPGHSENELPISTINDLQFLEVEANQLYQIKGTRSTIKMPGDLPPDTKLAVSEKSIEDTDHQGLTLAGDSFTFTFDFPEGSEQPSEPYTLSLGYEEEVQGEKDIYYYQEENDQWMAQTAKYGENQTLTIDVSHFSSYAVLANASEETESGIAGEEKKVQQKEKNDLPDTATNQFNILLVGILLLVVGISVWIIRRKSIS
ncbi:Ig-like domain-containing protein [Gracilibacillus suaedae]|uniref:Ig-like domain-containing protein n=1 Tax=Gracilibacillus suaedae TaxID=2820273 RepID=UPI001ABDFE6D|nr:glycoside hydrolase [Gracilibacillus suaedae]